VLFAAQLRKPGKPHGADIVVLDIEMRVMNGYEAATRIRQECSSPSCKLIAVSGPRGPRKATHPPVSTDPQTI
jgi:CheY-like chemotaxis protein